MTRRGDWHRALYGPTLRCGVAGCGRSGRLLPVDAAVAAESGYAPMPLCDSCREYLVYRLPDPPPLRARLAAAVRRLFRR